MRFGWMKQSLPILLTLVGIMAMPVGCTTSARDPTEAQRHFMAGQEEAFAMIQRSGIRIVRIIGPVQRPVIEWQQDMTVAEVILAAGYLETSDPSQILIQRGAQFFEVDLTQLLAGESVPIEPGDVIRVVP
jgi:hypothetical protein